MLNVQRLRGQALASNLFHLFAETIELTERGVDVGGNANSLEFVVHDGHSEDVVFVEQIFRNGFGIGAVDVNICYCARLTGIERGVEPDFGDVFEPVHPVTR